MDEDGFDLDLGSEDEDDSELDLSLGEDASEADDASSNEEDDGHSDDEEDDSEVDKDEADSEDDSNLMEEEEWKGIDGDVNAEQSTADDAPVEPTKYIPPHLRAAALAEKAAGDEKKAEERRKLERKAQGLLNK